MSDFSVFVSDALQAKIKWLANQQYPREYGGILTGLKTSVGWVLVDVEVPDDWQASPTQFTRQVDRLNAYLSQLYTISEGQLHYLGEWHSHPDGSTTYSQQDARSIAEISLEPGVKNATPLLWIVRSGATTAHQLYIWRQNKLHSLTYNE
ncbi:MAG: hypothetical protein EOO39_46900 [Cytophagaceae bacterium]|nr:MAG: hypothetical protein EOO39_46900 [Cytophagaceae bacterium]